MIVWARPNMKAPHAAGVLTVIAVMLLPGVSFAEEPFDGKWRTTVSCEAARDALGDSFRFVSEVKNGKFR